MGNKLSRGFVLLTTLSFILLFQNCGQGFQVADFMNSEYSLLSGGDSESLSPGKTMLSNSVDPELNARVLGSELKIIAPRLYAGAINSMIFRNKEYIDTADHGRQLQSAVTFDGHGECYNPTEAGSRDDHLKNPDTATSVLLSAYINKNFLETTTDAGFWLYPTEVNYRNPLNPSVGCGNKPGDFGTKNKTYRDGYIIHKTVLAGYEDIPNVLHYKVDYTLPREHSIGAFESLTGYMTGEFKKVFIYNTQNGQVERLGWEPMGEQSYPVIVTTENEDHAMGIYTLPSYGISPSYGRFDFSAHGTYKWNTATRLNNLSKGTYSFTHFVPFGTLSEVQEAMKKIICKHPPQNLPFNSAHCSSGPAPQVCSPYSVKSCSISNGQGQQTCDSAGSAYGSCQVISCNSGYVVSGNSCAVAPPSQVCSPYSVKSCSISNGQGQQSCDSAGSAYGICQVSSCNSGYVVSGNSCVGGSDNSEVNIPIQEIFKSYNSTDQSYLYSIDANEGTQHGYQKQGVAFRLSSQQTSLASVAVYRCLKQDASNRVIDRMLSIDPRCEGYQTEGVIGYAIPNPTTQKICFSGSCTNARDLYRCVDSKTGRHISTVQSGECNGAFSVEGKLGYAW